MKTKEKVIDKIIDTRASILKERIMNLEVHIALIQKHKEAELKERGINSAYVTLINRKYCDLEDALHNKLTELNKMHLNAYKEPISEEEYDLYNMYEDEDV